MSQDIGHRIIVRRAVLRMTQADLARRLGLARSYISMLENGERPLNDELLQRIAAALECTPEYLRRNVQNVAQPRGRAKTTARRKAPSPHRQESGR